MNKPFHFFIFFLLFSSFFSCKKPPATIQEPKVAVVPSCEVQEIDFTYFTSKAKLHYKDSQFEEKTNSNIRIKKDSVIWISVNAAAGFEAFRILILQDSLHILDRLKNTYSVQDYGSLSNALGIELNYKMLQGLLLGNLMLPRSIRDSVVQSDSSYCIFRQLNGRVTVTNTIRVPISKMEQVGITDGQDALNIKYLKFVPLGNYTFALENDITLTYNAEKTTQTVNIRIEHNKTEFPDKVINFPFNVPNRFQRK